MKSSVKWCVAACQDARCVTTIYLLLQPVNPKGLGLINRTKSAYPQRIQALLLDAARVFTLAKGSEGKVSLPLCSLTIWYYRYALTLRITKPDPTYAWHLELNTSLGTTTQNQPNRFVNRESLVVPQRVVAHIHLILV